MDDCGAEAFGVAMRVVFALAWVMTKTDGSTGSKDAQNTKETLLGMLDCFVGGGLRSEERPFDKLAREVEEEASISKQYTLAMRGRVIWFGTRLHTPLTGHWEGDSSSSTCMR
jgi:8-oxo-dGTP pyrophosphatase MutT (NUDIX family)